jgi:hypothetical protein
MNALKIGLAVAGLALSTQAAAQVVFYEHDDFRGRSFTAERSIGNFDRFGFNDRASSVVVLRDRWEVCTDAGFGGSCVVLRPGRYPSLSALGLNDRVSSVRPVERNARIEDRRYAPPPPVAVYDNYRRPDERLFEANVIEARAVYADAGQRCWVERDRVGSDANIGGAIVGGLIGGVLGPPDRRRARGRMSPPPAARLPARRSAPKPDAAGVIRRTFVVARTCRRAGVPIIGT